MWSTRASIGRKPPVLVRPYSSAVLIALVYTAVSALYIVYSGQIATSLSLTVEQLQAIEKIKGVGFVVVTGVLLFVMCAIGLKRIQRHQQRIFEQEELLLKSERKATAGMFAATLAHDLNNLLFALQGLMDGLETSGCKDEFVIGMRRDLAKSIARMSTIAKRVTSSAKVVESDQDELVEVHKSVDEMLSLLRKHRDLQSAKLTLREAQPISITVKRTLFEEALLNLIVNAGQAVNGDGQVEVAIKTDGEDVLVAVHDNGPGVPPGLADRIFDPTFTTKPQGTGLGLMAVNACAVNYGGTISVGSSDLGGAVFTLRLPKRRIGGIGM